MDSTLSLAFSMQKRPGVYALLLGSGISQSVGVKTGWEIAQDLIRRVKDVTGEELSEDTRYDQLLAALGKTKAARNDILREYFERKESDAVGIKLPSRAHQAIARLVEDGYVKVILTTNFDRLMEMALEEIHIIPDVIRSDAMLRGARPIRHSQVTIIQLHGDYRDIETLNTESELGSYSPEKNSFLDAILSEYGLIVCGWSASYDKALRNAIQQAAQRWYGNYWIEPYELSSDAKDVVSHLRADVIKSTADKFFVDLQGKVEALAKLNQEHP